MGIAERGCAMIARREKLYGTKVIYGGVDEIVEPGGPETCVVRNISKKAPASNKKRRTTDDEADGLTSPQGPFLFARTYVGADNLVGVHLRGIWLAEAGFPRSGSGLRNSAFSLYSNSTTSLTLQPVHTVTWSAQLNRL